MLSTPFNVTIDPNMANIKHPVTIHTAQKFQTSIPYNLKWKMSNEIGEIL